MAEEGNKQCAEILGDTLWRCSSPHRVITLNENSSQLRGSCNLQAIVSIECHNNAGKETPLLKLPDSLVQLRSLKRLVLTGHNISSDGVPAQIFDPNYLPKLTRSAVWNADPVMRKLDLSKSSGDIKEFLACNEIYDCPDAAEFELFKY